jgi:hypothetical protein
MNEVTSIINNFANAIQVDHLTKDELECVANIFKDFK